MINHIPKAVMYAAICLIKSHTSRHAPVSSPGSDINSPLFTSGNNWLTPLYFLFSNRDMTDSMTGDKTILKCRDLTSDLVFSTITLEFSSTHHFVPETAVGILK